MEITKLEDIIVLDKNKYTAWVNHHTATNRSSQFDYVNTLHKEKNWGTVQKPIYIKASSMGYYGGYNFIIDTDGTIYQYRAVGEGLVAHRGHNSTKGAIALAGNLTKGQPTLAQEESLKKLYGWLITIKALPVDLRHGDLRWNSTACPGIPKDYYSGLYKDVVYKKLQILLLRLRIELFKLKKDKDEISE